MDLALNNLQWLVRHKTKPKPNQIKGSSFFIFVFIIFYINFIIMQYPLCMHLL